MDTPEQILKSVDEDPIEDDDNSSDDSSESAHRNGSEEVNAGEETSEQVLATPRTQSRRSGPMKQRKAISDTEDPPTDCESDDTSVRLNSADRQAELDLTAPRSVRTKKKQTVSRRRSLSFNDQRDVPEVRWKTHISRGEANDQLSQSLHNYRSTRHHDIPPETPRAKSRKGSSVRSRSFTEWGNDHDTNTLLATRTNAQINTDKDSPRRTTSDISDLMYMASQAKNDTAGDSGSEVKANSDRLAQNQCPETPKIRARKKKSTPSSQENSGEKVSEETEHAGRDRAASAELEPRPLAEAKKIPKPDQTSATPKCRGARDASEKLKRGVRRRNSTSDLMHQCSEETDKSTNGSQLGGEVKEASSVHPPATPTTRIKGKDTKAVRISAFQDRGNENEKSGLLPLSECDTPREAPSRRKSGSDFFGYQRNIAGGEETDECLTKSCHGPPRRRSGTKRPIRRSSLGNSAGQEIDEALTKSCHGPSRRRSASKREERRSSLGSLIGTGSDKEADVGGLFKSQLTSEPIDASFPVPSNGSDVPATPRTKKSKKKEVKSSATVKKTRQRASICTVGCGGMNEEFLQLNFVPVE